MNAILKLETTRDIDKVLVFCNNMFYAVTLKPVRHEVEEIEINPPKEDSKCDNT